MDLALGGAPADTGERLRAVRAWWRERHPGPSLGQRLDLLYTVAITVAILGALAYGTASSALAQVVSPAWLARFGPALALLAVLLTARWGAYQGPVVFSVADVAHLLGAPLPRRGLAARRLALGLATGAAVGAVVAAVVLVGLAGEARGIAGARIPGLLAGFADLGVLAVAAAWTVERSARWDRAVSRAVWPAALVAAALVVASRGGSLGRTVALWSGPWGWAVQPGTHAGTAEWAAAILLLTALTVAAAGAVVRGCGTCPAERHLRRAEARASAVASLASFDARSARRALETASAGSSARGRGELRRMRDAAAARGVRRGTTALATVWRDAVAARSTPGRVVEAAVLAAAGSGLALTNAARPATVLAAMLLVYAGAARMLSPLRSELDVPSRARVLLRPRIGRVLAAHAVLPALVITAAAVLAAATCAITGALQASGAAAALLAVVAAPVVACCAAMSARRGGQLPDTVFVSAVGVDPSGGAIGILAWLAWWPSVAVALGAAPILIVTSAGSGAAVVLAGCVALAGAGLWSLLGRDPDGG